MNMSKIKIKIFSPVSMDGYASRIDGDINWTLRYLEGQDHGFEDFIGTVGSVVFNLAHYRMFQSHGLKWLYGDLPCHVITRRHVTYPSSRNIHPLVLHNGAKLSDREQLDKLWQGEGDIWLAGNNELVSQFLDMGLVDEVTVLILPVTLGNGLPLARRNSGESRWELGERKDFDNGMVRLKYHHKGTVSRFDIQT